MLSAPIHAPVAGEGVPPQIPFPLHTLRLQVEHPHSSGRGCTPQAPLHLPQPWLPAQGEGVPGVGGRVAAGTPTTTTTSPSAWPGAAPALPPPPHANDAAQRVRREGGREEGGREGTSLSGSISSAASHMLREGDAAPRVPLSEAALHPAGAALRRAGGAACALRLAFPPAPATPALAFFTILFYLVLFYLCFIFVLSPPSWD